ncbi:lamin tail domain-containing protein [Streptomyces bobili]|uniref:lamin tail domain-containing protein n=1 Tax=Streptomyces bobili TaxID=67280 RepID=UPI003422F808
MVDPLLERYARPGIDAVVRRVTERARRPPEAPTPPRAPGTDSNRCSGGNTKNEYLTIKNYSRTAKVNLKGYVVKDATGNKYTFTANHTLEPGDYVKLRGGKGTNSDAGNVVYRQNCNFIWNNDKDTIYLLKPGGAKADVHSYTRRANDPDGNGYINYHG